MNRLPEQLVAWHNRHPLALRITINDVHTVGIVALPFMRSGSQATAVVPMPARMPARMIEPVLGDAAAAGSGEPVWGGESVLMPAAEAAPTPAAPRWQFWRRLGQKKSVGRPNNTWPVFSECFLDGLSVRSISSFTQACAYATRPGPATWPTREVPIDDDLIAPADAASGAWPLELYLLSAAIDASESRRTRVLIGQGKLDDTFAVLGRRCLSPLRVGGAWLALVLLVGGGAAALWWPHGEALPAPAAVAAAVPASAPAPAPASSPVAEQPASAASAASATQATEAAASAPEAAPSAMAASGGGTAPDPVSEAEAASEPTRDIRPRLVERAYIPRTRQPTRAMLAPPEPASASASVSAPPSKPVEKAVEPKPDKSTVKPMPGGLKKDIEKGQSVVALVGPPSANKADAEALLARLQSAVEGARGKSNTALQAAVFQTPEGWRAAVWPFASREEAQIINATLVARGMKTRAVDF